MGRVTEGLGLHEIIRAELFKANPAGGWFPPVLQDVEDLITNNGCIHIARRISGLAAQSSNMGWIACGTMTTAASINDSVLSGEVIRKATAVASATSNNLYTAIATFGGAAESISSVQLTEAGLFNHAQSGQGVMMQRVTFAAVTLADSDLFKITLETLVGSRTI